MRPMLFDSSLDFSSLCFEALSNQLDDGSGFTATDDALSGPPLTATTVGSTGTPATDLSTSPVPTPTCAHSFSPPAFSVDDSEVLLEDLCSSQHPTPTAMPDDTLQDTPKPTEGSSSVMDGFDQVLVSVMSSLNNIRLKLQALSPSSTEQDVATLRANQTTLAGVMKESYTRMGDLFERVVLDPHHLQQLLQFKADLKYAQKQLAIYQRERNLLASAPSPESSPPCLAVLHISEDPFYQTVKQQRVKTKVYKKPSHLRLEVRLLTAATQPVTPTGPMLAELRLHSSLSDEPPTPNARKRPLTEVEEDGLLNNAEVMNSEGKAVFADLRFLHGTGGKATSLQFCLEVKYQERGTGVWKAETLSSLLTHPFIVLCNESRWDSGAGKMMKMEAFNISSGPVSRRSTSAATPTKSRSRSRSSRQLLEKEKIEDELADPADQPQITWPHFANVLQKHYLQATRQNPIFPDRSISLEELSFLHQSRLQGKQVITQQDFDTFWSWFGPVLHPIRHSKHLSTLYTKGYIYGLISKSKAEELLASYPVNTFLVR